MPQLQDEMPSGYRVVVGGNLAESNDKAAQLGLSLGISVLTIVLMLGPVDLVGQAPGFTLDAGGGIVVVDTGSEDSFTVVLDAEPANSVVLTITSGDAGEATVRPARLVFTRNHV